MKNKFLLSLVLLIVIFSSSVFASDMQNEKNVYVIPIQEEITPAVYQFVKHNLSIAEADPDAVAVIFEIDTYGGRIDSAEKISQLILNSTLPTISFVNTKAESAGVLLSISSDKIAMAPTGTIGSAETIPNTEKILSTWVGMLRSVAQEKGKDEKLVIAMADKSVSIPGIVQGGRLLNLTTIDAERLGFIDLIAKDYDEVLSSLSINYSNIIKSEITNSIKLAKLVSNPYIAPILLTVGFVGLLMEIFTAGFGVAGTVSLISFTLYFGGNVLAGNTGWVTMFIFLVGLILLIIEAIVPGFGVPGIGGIVCIIISIILASSSALNAIVSLIVSFVLTTIILAIIIKYAPRNKHFDNIVLSKSLNKEDGFRSSKNYDGYLGKVGSVITSLRPSGSISIDDKLLDVVSEGQFISKGESVKVVKVEGNKIMVRKID